MTHKYINKKYGHPRSGEKCQIITRGKGYFWRTLLIRFEREDALLERELITVQGHLRRFPRELILQRREER